jgi:hypothetical protein
MFTFKFNPYLKKTICPGNVFNELFWYPVRNGYKKQNVINFFLNFA